MATTHDVEKALLDSGIVYKDDDGDWRMGLYEDAEVNEEVERIIDYLTN